jgi:hypothetical protein
MSVEMEPLTEVQCPSATADSVDTAAQMRAMVKVGESEQTGSKIDEQRQTWEGAYRIGSERAERRQREKAVCAQNECREKDKRKSKRRH